jgi:hypothetical protein
MRPRLSLSFNNLCGTWVRFKPRSHDIKLGRLYFILDLTFKDSFFE